MEPYREAIAAATETIVEAILRLEVGPESKALALDGVVRGLLRQVGHAAMTNLLKRLSVQVTAAAALDAGVGVERRPQIDVLTLFGIIAVESPYLWGGKGTCGCRPVEKVLGLTHRKQTPALERALVDFGSEESFGQSAKRFEEHYGFALDRTTIRRVVEGHARLTEKFVEKKLAASRERYAESLATRPGAETMLVELDGCEIRTGTLIPGETLETTPVRGGLKKRRKEQWREVRVGLARPLDQIDATFVARMDRYEVVTAQIFAAACERGLSSRTKVVGVADGGNGLREEFQAQFPGSQFIYDRYHLKHHLYETAEEIGLHGNERETWVNDLLGRIDSGRVETVLERLAAHVGRGKKRVKRLLAHLSRFKDAVHYDAYRADGLPIGSGEIESAHRTIPQKRMKLPGAWWDPDNINPMLALRATRANGWWNEYWSEERIAA